MTEPPANWTREPLSNFIRLQRGFDLPHRSRTPGPFKVLSSGEASGSHDEGPVQGPGFVVGRATNIGRPTWSDEDYWPLNTVLYAKDFLGNDPKFAYYWFVANDLTAYNSGSVQPMLNRNYIANVPIAVPPVEEQRTIAAILSVLDDKIESDRRALNTLDLLLHAYWQKTAGNTQNFKHLSNIVTTQYGITASAEASKQAPKLLRVTDINKENWVSWEKVPSASVNPKQFEKYKLSKGDLLVARMADPGKSALYDDETTPTVFASYLVRLKPRNYAEALYIYGFLKSSTYTKYAAGAMSGSVQKNMNARVMVDVDIPWPPRHDLEAFADVASMLRSQINQKAREITALERLRDALLPELLSGRVRVPEAAEIVKGVIDERESA